MHKGDEWIRWGEWMIQMQISLLPRFKKMNENTKGHEMCTPMRHSYPTTPHALFSDAKHVHSRSLPSYCPIRSSWNCCSTASPDPDYANRQMIGEIDLRKVKKKEIKPLQSGCTLHMSTEWYMCSVHGMILFPSLASHAILHSTNPWYTYSRTQKINVLAN